MPVKNNIISIINHPDFLSYLIALILSTLLIGYAPSSIALGVFGFFVLRHAIIHRVKLRITPMLLLLVFLFLFFCTSYFWSVDRRSTLKGIGRLIPLLVIPISFSLIPKFSIRNYRLILNYFTISNVLLAVFFLVVALINYIKIQKLNVFTYHDLVEVLELNAVYVSVFFCISFFFLLSKHNKKQIEKGAIVLLGVMILLLSSKMMMIIFLLSIGIYLVFYRGFGNLKSYKSILVICIAAILFVITSRQGIERFLVEKTTNFKEVLHNEKFNKIYPWTGTSIRVLQLRNLKDQIVEDRIFWKGFGLFASRNNLKKRHIAYNTYFGYHEYNYHNMYAQIFSELGIFGLLFLVTILILNLRKAIQSKALLFTIFNVIFLMLFLTETFLWVHRGIFLFTIIFCLLNRTDFSNVNSLDN
jgi:O-antigen ligase